MRRHSPAKRIECDQQSRDDRRSHAECSKALAIGRHPKRGMRMIKTAASIASPCAIAVVVQGEINPAGGSGR